MANLGNRSRRCLGIIFLVIAGAMVVAGQTVFRSSLSGRSFVIYWLVCFLFTSLAILMALSELRAVQSQAREEQRDLLNQTFTEVQHNAEARRAESPVRRDRAG